MHAKKTAGFTLIEMMTVILILAAIGAMSMQFVASAMNSYTSTQDRGQLISRGRQALERMSRQLRGSLPNSVRVTNGGLCVEFLSIVGGGNYLDSLPDSTNGAAAVTSFSSGGYQVNTGTARYVYVAPMSSAEVYSTSAVYQALSASEDHSDTTVSLIGPRQFLRNSVTRRFYLVDNPEAFCLSGGNLFYYSGYGTPSSTTGVPGVTGVLLAEQVGSDASPFQVSLGSEDRSSVVSLKLSFTEQGESVLLNQKVFIRNVP